MIEHNAYEEHGYAPPQGAKHTLMTIFIGILTEQCDHCRISQGDGRSTEELSDQNDQEKEEKSFLNILLREKEEIILLPWEEP